MSLTICTYGGGEILRNIFNSIAILTGGDLMRSLMIIGVSCGAFWTISKAFFSQKAEAFMVQFLLPALAVTGLLMLPKTSVHIEDAYTNAPYKVDNVPWIIARPAELISTLGYQLTTAIESAMHVPNDLSYNKTGMVFGAETALDMRKYRLTNAVLEQNLKRFAKQCVFYDIALNRYSLDQLKKSTQLWQFLENNSSKVRVIPYADPLDPKKPMTYLSCQNAVKTMSPIFAKEKQYYALQDITKHLPLTFQALTGLQKNAEELISQQLMMQVLDGELGSDNFAKSRAYIQQNSTYSLLGSLASNSLVTMRAILEAIVYASVVIVLPMSVLPGGLSFISNWLWMVVWLQLWPPFYAIVNYILQIVARSKTQAIFMGLSQNEKGLSFFTNSGLAHLHEDIFAMTGYIAMLVPFISYAVVKGGVSSFIHLSSSLMNPGQSAASTAASEQTSGNYSFGNSSFGQVSYRNATSLQQNQAPSLSSGFFTENQGNLSATYTADETLLRQGSSDLRWGISSDTAITESFQKAQQSSEAFTESKQKSYMESVSTCGKYLSDLSSHLSQSENFQEGISSREAYDVMQSARYLQNQAHNLSQQYGISEHESMTALFGGNSIAGGVTHSKNTTTDELANSALSFSNSKEFQQNVQKLTDFARSQAHNTLNDEGVRLAFGTTQSFDEVSNAQQQYQSALSHSKQMSETASWAQQNTQMIRKSLNQDLVNWASKEVGYDESKRILLNGNDDERALLVGNFISTLHSSQMQVGDWDFSAAQCYEASAVQTIDKEAALNSLYQHHVDDARQEGLEKGVLTEKIKQYMPMQMEEYCQGELQNTKQRIHDDREKANISDYVYEKATTGGLTRLYDGPIDHTEDKPEKPGFWQRIRPW